MKIKATKFVTKIFLFFPLGFLIAVAYKGLENTTIGHSIFTGFSISFGIVFYQWFEYEKFSDLPDADFLESKHVLALQNGPDNWHQINELIKNPFLKLVVLEKTDDFLKVQIIGHIQDSILSITKTETNILIEIKSKSLPFFPDNANNYKTLQKLACHLKTENSY